MNRLEYKYLVPVSMLSYLRHRLAPYLEMDQYGVMSGLGCYTVRSIYFDSPRLSYYYDKIEGLDVRQKVRIRGYNLLNESSQIFMEVKRKRQRSISKTRYSVPYFRGLSLLERHMSGYGQDQELEKRDRVAGMNDFLFHMYRHVLRPIIRICYEREAYFHKFNRSLRITIDHNLRSALTSGVDVLFMENHLPVMYDHSILEIKFYGGLPGWLLQLISELGIKTQALSKYCICLNKHLNLNEFRPRFRMWNPQIHNNSHSQRG